MTIVNVSEYKEYSSIAQRDIDPGTCSADRDHNGMFDLLKSIVRGCGKTFAVRLNVEERSLVESLIQLDDTGKSYKKPDVVEETAKDRLVRLCMEETKRDMDAKEKLIISSREREESIRSETTWASREDIDSAKSRASSIKGEVKAKKLASTGEKPVSLQDLMGDNRYIEDNLKGSGIRTVLASEEGWDAQKVRESNYGKEVSITNTESTSGSDVKSNVGVSTIVPTADKKNEESKMTKDKNIVTSKASKSDKLSRRRAK